MDAPGKPPRPARAEASAGSLLPIVSRFRVRITRLSILPISEPLFSESCTNVSIADEAAGEFLEIEQVGGSTDADSHTIRLDAEEWPAIKQAIETLLADINSANDGTKPRRD